MSLPFEGYALSPLGPRMSRMSFPLLRTWVALLCVVLSACATSTSAVSGDEEPLGSGASWEEAQADPSCVVPLCDEERCALWRCQDVVEAEAPPVRLAWAQGTRLPLPNPTRWWGRPLAAPEGREAVFEIPWHNWNIRGKYAAPALRLPCIPAREPIEKHHIFPQESGGMVQGQGDRHPCLHPSPPQELSPMAAQWRSQRRTVERGMATVPEQESRCLPGGDVEFRVRADGAVSSP